MAGIDPIALAGISAGDSNTPPQYRRSSGGGSDEKPEGFARVPLMAPPATSGNGGDFRGWRPGDIPSTSSEGDVLRADGVAAGPFFGDAGNAARTSSTVVSIFVELLLPATAEASAGARRGDFSGSLDGGSIPASAGRGRFCEGPESAMFSLCMDGGFDGRRAPVRASRLGTRTPDGCSLLRSGNKFAIIKRSSFHR